MKDKCNMDMLGKEEKLFSCDYKCSTGRIFFLFRHSRTLTVLYCTVLYSSFLKGGFCPDGGKRLSCNIPLPLCCHKELPVRVTEVGRRRRQDSRRDFNSVTTFHSSFFSPFSPPSAFILFFRASFRNQILKRSFVLRTYRRRGGKRRRRRPSYSEHRGTRFLPLSSSSRKEMRVKRRRGKVSSCFCRLWRGRETAKKRKGDSMDRQDWIFALSPVNKDMPPPLPLADKGKRKERRVSSSFSSPCLISRDEIPMFLFAQCL